MSKLVFCGACRKQMDAAATVCPHCNAPRLGRRYKDRISAGLLAIFVGAFGVHRFYLGQWWGLFYLLFFWTFIPGFASFIEGIVFLCTSQERWDEKYNSGVATGASDSSRIGLVVVLVAVGFVAVAMIGIMAAIAIPAYADYTARSKIMGVMIIAHDAATAVEEYVEEKGALPASLSEAGFNSALPPNVRSIELKETNGDIVVTMSGNPFDGKSFALSPVTDGSDGIVWRCHALDIRDRYLPRDCRSPER